MNVVDTLTFMGYKLDVDFIVHENDDKSININWLSASPKPSDITIASQELSARKISKILELKIAAKLSIESGFVSSALGTPHTYDSDLQKDQLNILGAKVKGVDLMYTCTDINGLKIPRLHTAAQINQVFIDGSDWKYNNSLRFNNKVAIVNAPETTTIAQVDAIVF
jgi:hypothetical protein